MTGHRGRPGGSGTDRGQGGVDRLESYRQRRPPALTGVRGGQRECAAAIRTAYTLSPPSSIATPAGRRFWHAPASRAASTGPIPRFDASEADFLAVYPDPVAVGDLCLAGERTAPGTIHGMRERPDGRGKCVLADIGVFGMAPEEGRDRTVGLVGRAAYCLTVALCVSQIESQPQVIRGRQVLPHGGEPGLDFHRRAPFQPRPDPCDPV